jgi:hypothetical protein
MKRKVAYLKNLNPTDKILVTSAGAIDFGKQCTNYKVYFDGSQSPEYDFYAELHIFANNQPQTDGFELPVKGKNAIVVLEAITDFDLTPVLVLSKNQ